MCGAFGTFAHQAYTARLRGQNSRLLPPTLYRYRSLSGQALARTKQIICDSQLYFANPSSFNDPFDCRPTFSLAGRPEEVRRYLGGLFKKHAPHLDRSARRAEVRKQLKDPAALPSSKDALRGFADFYYLQISGKAGVLCLAEKPDELLMWSHYSDSHTGVCLGFRTETDFFGVAQPVRYSDLRPVVNPVHQQADEMLDLALYTKAMHWKYESEWRIVHYRRGPGVYRYPPDNLEVVILGARVSEENRQTVRGWLASHPGKPSLYQAKLSEVKFAIALSPG